MKKNKAPAKCGGCGKRGRRCACAGRNPFFAPEAMQYVARFAGLANPPGKYVMASAARGDYRGHGSSAALAKALAKNCALAQEPAEVSHAIDQVQYFRACRSISQADTDKILAKLRAKLDAMRSQNPPAGRALFEGDNDVLFNPDESLQQLERLVEQNPNDLGLSLRLLRARQRAGVPFGHEAQRLAGLVRGSDEGISLATRRDVLQALVESNERGGMILYEIGQVMFGERNSFGLSRADVAQAFRALLRKYGATQKDVSLTTPQHSMASAIDVSVKTAKGRAAMEKLFLFMEAGGPGGPPRTQTSHLYPHGRENRDVAQADEYNPGGPVIRNESVLDMADALVAQAAQKGLVPPQHGEAAAVEQENLQIDQVVTRADGSKGLAAKKRFVISEFTIDSNGRKRYGVTAMQGGVKGSEGHYLGSQLRLHPDQSLTFEGPWARQLRSSHEHRKELHAQFHPDGYYAKDPRRQGDPPAEPIMQPIAAYGVQLWTDEAGETLARTSAGRHEAFVQALRGIGVNATKTFTPGVYSLGHADPADVWFALVDSGFEGLEAPSGEDEDRLYLKNPRKRKEPKGPFKRRLADHEKATIVQLAAQHGADTSHANTRMSMAVGPFYFPPPDNLATSRAFEAACAQAVPGAHAEANLLHQPGGGTDTMIAAFEQGPRRNPFFAPEAMQYVARFAGLANPPPKKLTKKALVDMLAERRIQQYPDLYRGAEDSARDFYRREGGHDLLVQAQNAGLVPYPWKGGQRELNPPGERRCAACLIRLPQQAPEWAPHGTFGTCATCAERSPQIAKQRMLELSAQSGPFVFPKNMPKSLGAEAPASFYGVRAGWPYGHDYRTGPRIEHGR